MNTKESIMCEDKFITVNSDVNYNTDNPDIIINDNDAAVTITIPADPGDIII